MKTRAQQRWTLPGLGAAVAITSGSLLAGGDAAAQGTTPKVFYACYVPGVGAVYRIKEPGLPQQCLTVKAPLPAHVQFSWTDGTPANDHGALNGLADDDHPQYLLANGTRALGGALNAGGNKITGLAAATAAGEALRFEQAIKDADAAGGDLAGTYPNPTVSKLQGNPVSSAAPTASGDVLTWNGTAWAPATPASGVSDHGALSGLGDDGHAQYLLSDGVRATTNGFAVTGTLSSGTIPVEGSGTRLLWYPGKAAIRAGHLFAFGAGFWNDANIGFGSAALGINTLASGSGSFAVGVTTRASGHNAIAMGATATASGDNSIAVGDAPTATAKWAIALGRNVAATGDHSLAIGTAAETGHTGSFVYGDLSTGAFGAKVTATAPNQFVARAAGGTTFYSDAALTAGASLAPGAGAWASISDVRRKENFRDLDADSALAKIARMPVREWNYKAQDSTVRHVGPTAQDFYAAFKLAANDTTITTSDIDGVALLAIQALERRTAELQARSREIDSLRAEIAELRAELARTLRSRE